MATHRVSKALLVLMMVAAALTIPVSASAQADGGNGGRAAPGQEPPAAAALPASPTAASLSDVLPDTTRGDEALAVLSTQQLGDVAAQNGQSVAALTDTLANDSSAWLDPDGMLLFMDPPPLDEYLADSPAEPGPFPNGSTFFLHSRPGSNKTIYLDFDGYTLPAGTAWNGGVGKVMAAYDTGGNAAVFDQTEIDTIQSTWQRVAEDYAAFDVDVTTQDPGYARINRADVFDTVYGTRNVATSSPSTGFCGGCGGVAYIGVFDFIGANHDFYQPAWVFNSSLRGVSEASSHEVGHNIGLIHDGTSTVEYYAGHGMWAPIMGVGYSEPVVQWSRGEYTGANNFEDDYAVAGANGLALVADDETGCLIASTANHVQNAARKITTENDCDAWRYVAPCTGTYTIDTKVAPTSPNLSVQMNLWQQSPVLQLQNSAVQPVESNSDLATGMGETTTQAFTAGVVYTIAVFPLQNGTPQTGWGSFANRGDYSVNVSTPCGADQFGVSTIGGPFDTRSANNAAYSAQPGEPNVTCGDTTTGTTNSAWWSWTAPASGTVTFDTVGSSFDTVLGVFTGASVNALSPVACNDDFSGLQSSVTIGVTGGTTYRLQVDGYNGASGNIVLNTKGCVPVNNNTFGCANTLTTGPVATGSNVGFNTEGGEPSPACGFNPGTTAWWNWTAPGTGSFTLNTVGSNFDTVLGVYTGSQVNGLTAVTCNDDFGGLQSSVTFNATAGTVYRIQVSGYSQLTGTINLRAIDNRPFIRPFGTVVAEGNSGTSVANPVVYLETPGGAPYVTPVPITVNFTTVDLPGAGIATAGSGDYVASAGTLTFPAGSSQATVPITINGDTTVEPPAAYGEWAVLSFNTPSNNARLNTSAFYGLGIIIIVDEVGG